MADKILSTNHQLGSVVKVFHHLERDFVSIKEMSNGITGIADE